MVDHHLTGAHYGVKDWIIQRLSAILILFFSIILIIGLFFVPSSYQGWQQFFTYITVKIIAQLIVISLVVHAWIGMRDIWMDYIDSTSLRLFLHTATVIWLLANLIYSINIIWGYKDELSCSSL